ncbi:hypothetical protein ACSFA2_20755 [Variovorax sp. LT2P21]|uniref:hypothetical protein n=1 Tax=Variovorax sp. LT2P21 TaxID=3443731 RepID=UPI003F46EC4D
MTPTPEKTTPPPPTTKKDMDEALAGDRGSASGRNIEQNRAIGQDDPVKGSRMGRERDKADGYPGAGDPGDGEGTDAVQATEGTPQKPESQG